MITDDEFMTAAARARRSAARTGWNWAVCTIEDVTYTQRLIVVPEDWARTDPEFAAFAGRILFTTAEGWLADD